MDGLSLRTFPDDCLRKRTEPVTEFGKWLTDVLREMANIMYLNQGCGLAAPQVGLDKNIFVTDVDDDLCFFVNPEIVERSADLEAMDEGCLSLPGVTVRVKRPARIRIQAQDSNGTSFFRDLDGLAARAAQHEYDHLNGRLIIDNLNPIQGFIAKKKLMNIKASADGAIRTCEVVCNARKKDRGRT
ncbi:MAG: peptide deformylase [Candidatus Omnitrophica bacterium]|nr:peptide deformylase [Candidatus Omnitrophota bacterium]MDD5487975.1 peptide deformylase [Candidatus Omnitrophota bacterium]